MQRLSNNMDKLLAHMHRDIRFRKTNKKIQYPTPKINPRIAPPVSAQEIRKMKDGLKDEGRNIIQIAFLPESDEGGSGGPRITIPGEDIPDAPGRHRCTAPFTVQPFAYTSCTSRLRALQGSHRMGDQWHQL